MLSRVYTGFQSLFEIRQVRTDLRSVQSKLIQKCLGHSPTGSLFSINVSYYEFFDISHISNKFPNAQYLIERCGKANTRRRQLLKYYKSHHNKIAEEESTSNADHPERPQTTVSAPIQKPQEVGDVLVETHLSQTSFASSAGDGANTHLRVPPLPTRGSAYDDEPFQCPFCFSIISITGEQAWKYVSTHSLNRDYRAVESKSLQLIFY
jgi:hypothetical protein